MTSKRGDLDYLQDMVEAGKRVAAYCKSMDCNVFMADTKTQDAVVRNLEIMGEAAKKVGDQTRSATLIVPWKDIAGMRDRLIHAYFGVNWDIVWAVVSDELQSILEELEGLIAREFGNDKSD